MGDGVVFETAVGEESTDVLPQGAVKVLLELQKPQTGEPCQQQDTASDAKSEDSPPIEGLPTPEVCRSRSTCTRVWPRCTFRFRR